MDWASRNSATVLAERRRDCADSMSPGVNLAGLDILHPSSGFPGRDRLAAEERDEGEDDGVRSHGVVDVPVISERSLKNARLRGLLMAQFTGTLW